MKTIRNALNFEQKQVITAEPKQTQPSMTVPDQALPLATLLQRFVRGQDVVTMRPEYSNVEKLDDVFPDFEKMNFFEKRDLQNMVRQNINNLRDRLDQESKDRINAELAKAAEQQEPTPEA